MSVRDLRRLLYNLEERSACRDPSRRCSILIVETLVAEGHVTAMPDPSDKRQVLVALTPAGRAMTERLVRENAKRLRETFGALSDDELRTLSHLLCRLQPTEDGQK